MLDSQTISIIKSTVPVLETYGLDITKTFYKNLFSSHPELLNMFNHANQRQDKQQTALANAVYAAAMHIDRLEEILPVVKGIAHKHRALGVKSEHYPIVGQHLLEAIQQVLGEAATPEIIAAWGKAYSVIADVFIEVELEMYEQAASQTGGWKGFRRFLVKNKKEESHIISSLYLEPEDGKPIAIYAPGQYITVKVKPENQPFSHLRHYSLSSAPQSDYYRISVKREEADVDKPSGYVSNYLHESISEGDVLEISAPAGNFILEDSGERPVVLISGGVGQTPLLGMLEALVLEGKKEVVYIHAARSAKDHAFKNEVANWKKAYDKLQSYVVYDSADAGGQCDKVGRIDLPWLKTVASQDADYYFCGPLPFMREINLALKNWGIPESRIHFEFFGPADQLN